MLPSNEESQAFQAAVEAAETAEEERLAILVWADWLEDLGEPIADFFRQIAKMDELLDWNYWDQEPAGGMVVSDRTFWTGGPSARFDISEYPDAVRTMILRRVERVAKDRGYMLKETESSWDLERVSENE